MSEEEVGLDLSDKYGTNPKAEITGVWQELGGGAAIKVARLGNKEAVRAYKKIPKAIRIAVDEGILEGTQAEAFLAGYLAENILKDWRGLMVDGKDLPKYDVMEGKKFMIRFRRFRERVWELSADDDLFNVEAEEDAKNLPKDFSGGSPTAPMPLKPSAVAN